MKKERRHALRASSTILEPDNPLMSLAIGAMKRYHEAQAAKLADSEIKRLRLDAKSLFQAVSDFQQRVGGAVKKAPLTLFPTRRRKLMDFMKLGRFPCASVEAPAIAT